MESITQKELMYLDEMLRWEELLIKKYQYYSYLCDDPQLKALCEEYSAKQKKFFENLLCCL